MMTFLFLLLTSTSAHCFTWEEAKSISRERDLGIRSADYSQQASTYAKRKSYSAFLPTLTLSARKNKSVAEAYGIESQSKSHTYSATASLNLFNGFASTANVQKTTAAENQAEAQKSAASMNARYELRLAFTDLFIQQERVRVFEKTLKRQQQNERLVSIKYDSGTEAKWNVLKTKAERERAEFNLESAKTAVTIAKEKLLALLNVSQLPSEEARSPQQDLQSPAPTDEENLLAAHPLYLDAKYTLNRSEKDIAIARSAFLPSIDLSYSKSREFNELGAKNRTDTWSWSVVAQWNIFNGFSDFHQWQQVRMTRNASQDTYEETRLNFLQEMRATKRELQLAISRLPSTRSIREAAEARVKTVSAQYRSGLKSYLDWEQAEAQLNESEQTEISALANAFQTLASYEKSIGKTLDD
jgi:adhesin transport system outer membrane protein